MSFNSCYKWDQLDDGREVGNVGYREGWMGHFIQLSEHISLNGRAKVNLNVVIDCFLIAIISGCTSMRVKTNKCVDGRSTRWWTASGPCELLLTNRSVHWHRLTLIWIKYVFCDSKWIYATDVILIEWCCCILALVILSLRGVCFIVTVCSISIRACMRNEAEGKR